MNVGITSHSKVSRGLTLIETLVVVFVIGLLLTLLLPALGRARERGRIAKCQSNLKQIHLMLSMYADDHEGVLPPGYVPKLYESKNWATKEVVKGLASYGNSDVFYCPSDRFTNNSREYEYSYYDGMRLLGRKLADLQGAGGSESVLLSEYWYWHGQHWYSEDRPKDVQHTDPSRQPLFDGRINILHGDGSVRYSRSTLYKHFDLSQQ